MGTYRHANYGDDVVGEVISRSWSGRWSERVASRSCIAKRSCSIRGSGFAKRSEHSLRVLA